MHPHDPDDWDGIEVETPVGTFRAGRGPRGDDDFRSVRRSVRRRIGFYRLVWTAVCLFGVLLIVDLLTGWHRWSLIVGLILGVIVVLRFLSIFVFDSLIGREAERRMIESELRKRESRGH